MLKSEASSTPVEELRRHLKWFLLFRVLILSCFLGTVGFLHLAVDSGDWSHPIYWLLATVILIYGITFASLRALRRVTRLEAFTFAQVAIDALLMSGAVLLTGAADSPFVFLYSLTIFNAAILLHARGAAIAALLASGTYTALVLTTAQGWWGAGIAAPEGLSVDLIARLLIHNSSFFVLAYLSAVLTQRLHETARQLAQKTHENDRLARLQDAMARHVGCGMITTDVHGRITSANDVVTTLTNSDLGSLLGRNIGSVFPPLHLTQDSRTAFLQSTGHSAATEFRHALAPDKTLLLRCSATALQDTYANPIGALYTLQDVTLLRELESRYRDEGEAALASIPEELTEDDDSLGTDGFVGRSPEILQVRALIEKVAPSDATILLQGESGTGKEVAARAIHSKSERKDKPFVAINCGAIPEHLIESELFGHVKGAFTGAISNRPGFFRSADGGTVFLDEIAELPPPMQVKLLRVLQERVFKPVGGETQVAVNVRVIAASNKDILAEVNAGRFREDLFYRLNVITVDLPPLRGRKADIPLLIRHFLRQFSTLHDKRVLRLSVPAARRLLNHDYPGNVRELANMIEHAVALCDGETVHEVHLPAHILDGPRRPPSSVRIEPEATAVDAATASRDDREEAGSSAAAARNFSNLDDHLATYEKNIILKALDDASGVKKRAADLLGINYRSFRHRLAKYGLNGSNGHAEEADSEEDRQYVNGPS